MAKKSCRGMLVTLGLTSGHVEILVLGNGCIICSVFLMHVFLLLVFLSYCFCVTGSCKWSRRLLAEQTSLRCLVIQHFLPGSGESIMLCLSYLFDAVDSIVLECASFQVSCNRFLCVWPFSVLKFKTEGIIPQLFTSCVQ